ncbi:MAG: glycosyltransferase family 39 protein, partial [Chloroflexota bacterium]
MPHIPDEVSYIFQAKVLSSGRLAAPPPPVPESFDFFFPSLIVTSHGKFASIYPFGHPLVLALGVRVGAVWLIPPLLGAACVTLMFAIGRRVYNARTALLAALMMAASPFFLMNASSFMSHNTAVFYILASLLFLACARKRPVLYPVISGVFFGLVFNTRPLTATALALPFGAMLLSLLLPRGQRASGAKQIGAFVLGGLLMLGAYWLYNLGTNGTLQGGYEAGGDVGQVVGFGGQNTVANGMQNDLTQLAFFSLVLNGWPRYIGLMFVLLPFILGTRRTWDWFMLACAVSVMGVYTLYLENGVAYGPRYWYESIPFLMILAARGAERAAE